MATNKSSANRIPDWAGSGKPSGVKMDPGPFVGVIKNNVDPSRQGRLSVWIPEIGGAENDPTKWYVVRYASPFFGSTIGTPGTGRPEQFGTELQSYGFWAVPPDIGNLVLITFVMGDPSRGYWFACIPHTQSQHMVPGIARPGKEATSAFFPPSFGKGRSSGFLPSSEVNYENVAKDTTPEFYKLSKVIHTYQANIVIEQGLETDTTRGTITSSSQRESPSAVFGISTPGRYETDLALVPNLDALLKQGVITNSTIQRLASRKGGHTFVMDDGDIRGDSRLIRLRTAAGHQLLMHDTENTIYISNSLGTAWVELNGDGSVNVFGGGSVNIRAQKDLNLHADGDVNIHAGDSLRMYAGALIHSQTKTQLITADDLYNINAGVVGIRSGGNMDVRSISGSWETSGLMSLKNSGMDINSAGAMTVASVGTSGWKTTGELWYTGSQVHLNTSGKAVATPASPTQPEINSKMQFYNQTNARFDNDFKKWYKVPNDFESVAAFTPTHEPWARASGKLKLVNGEVVPSNTQYTKK